MGRKITVALAGNPNSGKTTLFNNLTGARQHVGNYPGVTVEKKEGTLKHGELEILVVDLPGTYSLTAYSMEELVARNFVIDERPDMVVDILDASNLERNLYLAVQFIELGVPLVLALNMSDVARARGIEFDLEKLSGLLGVPIVPTVGHKGLGTKELLDKVISVAKGNDGYHRTRINYGREIEEELHKIQRFIGTDKSAAVEKNSQWQAVKLLENDKEIRKKIGSPEMLAAVEKSAERIEKIFGDHPEIVIADRRYGFISGACQEAVRSTVEARHTLSDRIDAVVTNRALSFPIFLGLMYLVFQLTFTLGDPPMGWIENLIGWLGDIVNTCWPRGSESALKSLLVDGIIGGVGSVIVFLPNILLLFLAIAILEDSGYMARAAFIMDRLMHKIGLHGKSFIPMLIGFGCSVPAIMATRTLENQRDRLTTMLVAPLMSCSARLPIYALIIPAFFPKAWHAPMLWIIYMIGIALAILSAKLLRSTLFKGASTPFVMELPPYRIPTLKGVFIHMWERGWLYLKKAGTVILAVSILLWAMTSYPKKSHYDGDYEAQAAQAAASFLAGIRGIQDDLGLPSGSEILIKAVRAELDMAADKESCHDFEEGYAEAEQKIEAALDELKKSTHGAALAGFLEMREAVEQTIGNFEEALEEGELEEGSHEYFTLEKERDDAFAREEMRNPRMFAAVSRYLEEVKVSFDEKMAGIEQAQQMEDLSYSVAGRVGRVLEPILHPMGFDWRIGTALIGAFAAKEVFVAQMGIVYSVGEADEGSQALRNRLKKNYSPLVAFCIMLFCLVSAPCMATIAVTRRESNSWKWAMFQLGGLTVLACLITVIVFQAGSLFGIGVG